MFTHDGEHAWHPTYPTRAWVRLAKGTGIRLHDLRHTMASNMLAGGVDPVTVSKRLGHSRTTVTLDIYAHSLPGRDADAAERFAL